VDLLGYTVHVRARTLGIIACAALKAIRETWGSIEQISKLVALPDSGHNRLDLNRLSQDELGVLIRAIISEMSTRDRKTFLPEAP
jgi:hypothetical protein